MVVVPASVLVSSGGCTQMLGIRRLTGAHYHKVDSCAANLERPTDCGLVLACKDMFSRNHYIIIAYLVPGSQKRKYSKHDFAHFLGCNEF